jgi:hypothetical protein
MNAYTRVFATLAIVVVSANATAQYTSKAKADSRDPAGMYFQHKEWELACDNTGTCRAAGYPTDENADMIASVLLTRAAGASTPVSIEFKAQSDGDGSDIEGGFTLQLAGASVGRFVFGQELPAAQVRALLPKLLAAQQVDVVQGSKRWKISLAGLSAVALKMDEWQRRLQTVSALAPSARGSKNESAVRPAANIPTVQVPRLPVQDGIDKVLYDPLREAIGDTGCSETEPTISIYKLNERQVLVQIEPCEMAAYNSESAYYLAKIKPPHAPKRLEFDNPANEFSNGVITGYHKGRGIGDCVSTAEYAWNGTRFFKANVAGSGMCKGFLGGAWDMPTVVSKVNNPNR